jgi:hypothetical protein
MGEEVYDDDYEVVAHAKPGLEITSNNRTIELNISKASSQLPLCHKCKRRKAPFVPAYYCNVCMRLWFMLGEEAGIEAEKVWKSEKEIRLSKLELERINWNINNPSLISHWNTFYDFIRNEKPELIPELEVYIR